MPSRLAVRLLRSGGRLGTRDRVRLVLHGVLAQAGLHKPPPTLVRDVERLLASARPPEGVLPAAAFRACETVSPPWLRAHCARTWAWAAALGTATGMGFDAPLLYAAALLHDLGLTDAYRPRERECFAVTSAREARTVVTAAGAMEAQAQSIADAIALHMEVRVGLRQGVEAHLLHAGAAADVLGTRLETLPVDVIDQVLREHPRGDMNTALAARLTELSSDAPRTRLALYCRRFAFLDRVRRTRISGTG